MEEKKTNRVRAVSLMMLLTLIGKVLGLVRDMLLGSHFATGTAANAFLAASRIPRNFFDAIFASAISASFIPVFNEYVEKKGKQEALRLFHAFVTLVALATAVLSVLGAASASPLVAFLADGFDAETASLCAKLLRLLFPTVFFTGIAFSLVGVLQSFGEFTIPALLSTVSNGVIVLYYLFFCDRFGIVGLAAAFLLGWAMQVLVQLPALHRFGVRYRPALRHEGLRKVFFLSLPVLLSTWVQPLNLTVATKYASRLNGGAAASALEYANTLYTIVAGVFVLSVANVMFPDFSRMSARAERGALEESLKNTLGVMLFLLTPMAVGMSVLAEPIVRLIYERGAWGEESTALTAGALAYLSLGMLGYGVQIILSRAYYAEQKGKMPLLAGALSVLSNFALCELLSPVLGLRGLAIASAVSLTVPAAVLFAALARRYGALMSRDALWDAGKMVLCAAVMGAAVYVLRTALAGALPDRMAGRLAAVALPVLMGAALYLVLAWLLRVSVTGQLREIIQKRRGRV